MCGQHLLDDLPPDLAGALALAVDGDLQQLPLGGEQLGGAVAGLVELALGPSSTTRFEARNCSASSPTAQAPDEPERSASVRMTSRALKLDSSSVSPCGLASSL